MFAAVIEHPIFQAFKRVAFGEHAFVVDQAHRTEPDAKAELRVPKAGADDRVDTEAAAFWRLADLRQAVCRQGKPTTGEGMDFRGNVEIFAQNGFQSFGVASLASEAAREK